MDKRFSPSSATILLVAALLSSAVLAGCNTVSGAGQDLSAAGNAIDRTATDAKNK
jgi:entericidin B